jgi:hypothetical protein
MHRFHPDDIRVCTAYYARMSETITVPDRRGDLSHDLDERETLIAFLDKYRETVLVKLDGLDREQLSRRLLDSRTTLLGIVKHLIVVEQWWFATVVAGEPELHEDISDPDAEWLILDGDNPEQIVAEYRAVCAHSNAIARRAKSLDLHVPDDTHVPERHRPGKSVRWILVHMLEETARHAGHADILRELIDGRTGY